jgi:hypothetical protein
MEEFTILKTIKESQNYVVQVGIVPGDKVPQYLIFHKEHGVLEFAHNMIYYINQALGEMEEKLEEQQQEVKMEQGALFEEDEAVAENPKPRKGKKRTVN